MQRSTRQFHLRHGGTSVVIDLAPAAVPAILHWGEDLGDLSDDQLAALADALKVQPVSGGLDTPARLTLLPTEATGWAHTPGLTVRPPAPSPLFRTAGVQIAGPSCHVTLTDDEAGLQVDADLDITDAGLVRQRLTLTNRGDRAVVVDHLAPTFPLPADATELLDTTGHHLRERSPQRHGFTLGVHQRESRRGRPGFDNTLVLAAGRPGFGWERGRVHAVHLAWSGDHRYTAERTYSGDAFLQAGELLLPGEITLLPGASYTTPWALGSWGDGLNAVAARYHAYLRGLWAGRTPSRPVTLNTWEAVYFDHDVTALTDLARLAARVGAERFVLDDGWFRGRHDDTAGLGDWYPDATTWPTGLGPLADTVRSLGLEFGLWVEPEMVNPDSDLARAHPDWLLQGRQELPPAARHQQVLDLTNPAAYAYIAERLHALVTDYGLAYLKWDHNRDLVTPYSVGRPAVHAQTEALYRLLDDLKAAHPGLAIESCASGGARVDLGILERTDRVWTSDCLDPLERLPIQKWTGLVVPPEYLGAHLTSPTVHSTGRTVGLDLSAGVALFGHLGIEWDLRSCDGATLDRVARWVELYKSHRRLIATGRLVHADLADPALDLRGVVAADQSTALFALTQVTTSAWHPPAPVTFPGLDPDTAYTVTADTLGPLALTGRQLATTGLRPPQQHPEHLTLIHVAADRHPHRDTPKDPPCPRLAPRDASRP
ncbi:MAG: alpha-galactosidase [Propionibacteriaceae bacterium]|jgi:alpha-galactosidase|nr:alpha-galactosidase [Propionibacteriaceae bacterium]